MKKHLFLTCIISIAVIMGLGGCSKSKTTQTTTTAIVSTTTATTTNSATSTTTLAAFTVNVNTKTGIGTYLVDGNGETLYWTALDSVGQSNVTGAVLGNWPIFYSSNIVVPSTLNASDFSSITRADGNMQTTYKGRPLYYYINDQTSGSTLGQGINGVWFAVNPSASGPTAATTTTTAATSSTTTTTTATTTALSSSPYQGSGTGTWSGTILYNNVERNVGGTITEAIDANGNVTGSITGTSGSVASATHSLQIDPNGNITGTSSFVVGSTTYNFTWAGKVTVSGNTETLSGTWTGQLGSGVFSLTGTLTANTSGY
jgi:predicted lipoprotein with Yx(FWY)xxD motif